MARSGPLLTLLGGVALAALLFALDVRATGDDHPATGAAAAAASAATRAAPSTGAAPTQPDPSAQVGPSTQVGPSARAASPPPRKLNRGTYGGYTNGAGALLGIAVHDGLAVAYLCDGRKIEAWLRGTAADGRLELRATPTTARTTATLTARYSGTTATGQITVGGKRWTFTLHLLHPPSGLYRATAEVRGAKVTASWVVADGRQLGVQTVNDTAPRAAPPLDLATGRVDLGTGVVTATRVDADTGSGF